ncbi:MAG: hypothetical protein AB1489_19370 [Acidobacteriota bacterium]
MLQRFSLFVILILLIISFSGCGSSAPTTIQESAVVVPPTPKPITTLPAYRLEYSSQPATIPANKPVKLSLLIKDTNGNIVTNYEVAHEKLMHLIIVSSDLKNYYHLHPELQPDGKFIETVQLAAGKYKMWAGVKPKDGSDQNLPETLVVGEQPALPANLIPDSEFSKESEGLKVKMQPSLNILKAGEDVIFNYELTDIKTGKPVTDLEPYLGAMGHLVIISEDTNDFLHCHPMGGYSQEGAHSHENADTHKHIETNSTSVSFHTQFPRPGRYKAWSQFKRAGKIITISFVVQLEA